LVVAAVELSLPFLVMAGVLVTLLDDDETESAEVLLIEEAFDRG
jgi:hypothetical protein